MVTDLYEMAELDEEDEAEIALTKKVVPVESFGSMLARPGEEYMNEYDDDIDDEISLDESEKVCKFMLHRLPLIRRARSIPVHLKIA